MMTKTTICGEFAFTAFGTVLTKAITKNFMLGRFPTGPSSSPRRCFRLAAVEQTATSEEIRDQRISLPHPLPRNLTMREFFKGWNRKAGIATLLMASAFAVGWARGLVV